MTRRSISQDPARSTDLDPGPSHGAALLPALAEGVAERQQQPLAGHPEDIVARLARGRRQVVAGLTAELEDVEVVVDQDADGGVLPQHEGVGRALPVHRRDGRRGEDIRGLPRVDFPTVEGRVLPQPRRFLGVDAILRVHHAEQARERADRLRGAQHEKPVRVQGVMERRDDLLLERRAEVDQHVAATDQVDAGEGRIGHQVLLGEDAQIANRLVDPICCLFAGEEAAESFRRHVRLDVFGIDARAAPSPARRTR